MSSVLRFMLVALTCLWLGGLGGATLAARGGETASAQSLLFDAPYLARLDLPTTLSYRYRHKTEREESFGRAFEDTVRIKVAKSEEPGGLNAVSLEVFSGDIQRLLGPHADMRGNPIIMIFLERDLWAMKRRVGGVPVYFRNRIRKAFRKAAAVEPVEIDYDGRTVPAHKVTITPFHDDANGARLKEYRGKSYEFVVAQTVPGGFYRIRAWVPSTDGEAPLIEDMMIFTGADEKVQ